MENLIMIVVQKDEMEQFLKVILKRMTMCDQFEEIDLKKLYA
jgi:hypothetical protein